MQFTKSIVATALALFASSAVATTVDIAYTSNGVYYNQQVESDVRTYLSQPGSISTFQNTANCYLFSYSGQEVYYAAAGATNINPPVYAAFVQCQDPSST
ncbi:hypothetical protein AAWM_10094 [Aspergillus awamori]|uniref:Uncharacterized protein n=2 Tax=Aspergillus TaxID=5052 RepID=A0A3F3PKV7_9EURO|nr:hypothetical protein BDQ94DRAFT_163546 [Aspergillus welwitschiae]GCB27209.1 hypothetical protein AAWM_10094 [Aspergillus awamori]GKZ58944.1 hypothetical protein AnigIFM49718_004789 [Aspergillus niger]RDH27488.1 hypothetical protein BDQ94DRAFT_163546 [Aspergillus welwitschiae]GKZ66556.1 hypothetical protein AnigIFM50267_000420 [Aspergillus niger]GKZ76334.1 hypothetical protein AnigIFM56816_005314 [Aspergillus niger]